MKREEKPELLKQVKRVLQVGSYPALARELNNAGLKGVTRWSVAHWLKTDDAALPSWFYEFKMRQTAANAEKYRDKAEKAEKEIIFLKKQLAAMQKLVSQNN